MNRAQQQTETEVLAKNLDGLVFIARQKHRPEVKFAIQGSRLIEKGGSGRRDRVIRKVASTHVRAADMNPQNVGLHTGSQQGIRLSEDFGFHTDVPGNQFPCP